MAIIIIAKPPKIVSLSGVSFYLIDHFRYENSVGGRYYYRVVKRL